VGNSNGDVSAGTEFSKTDFASLTGAIENAEIDPTSPRVSLELCGRRGLHRSQSVDAEAVMEIQNLPVNAVFPYPQNPRKNSAAVKKVAKSISEFGFRQPIVVDEEMMVIVGHTRLEAAKLLDLETVPVHIAKGLSAKQVKAYRLADNRTGEEADWDFERLREELASLEMEKSELSEITGFDDKEIAKALAEDIEPDTKPQLQGLSYAIIIRCLDDTEQMQLLEEFEKQGLRCEALIS
jgi:ParB-like chromosome segregation protein Spo0J